MLVRASTSSGGRKVSPAESRSAKLRIRIDTQGLSERGNGQELVQKSFAVGRNIFLS